MKTQFTITAANKEIKEIACTSPSVTIGRSAINDIQLLDPKVSRTHCRIEMTELGVVLFDLGSKNGSYVNGSKCKTAQIKQSDILKIGSNIFDLTPATPKRIEQQERTEEVQALPWVPPQDERTREVNIRSSIDLDKSKEYIKFFPLHIFSNRVKYTQFVKNNKFYFAAAIIFCLPIIAFSTNYFTHAPILNSQPLTPVPPSLAGDDPSTKKIQITKHKSSPKDIETANQIAREANLIFESGDFKQATTLFDKALSLDAENILAKQGIAATTAYVKNLATICFTRGQKCLRAFDYNGAVKEFETVVLLLQEQQDNKLFIDAAKLIKQSQLKASN